MDLREQFAADLSNVIERDIPERIRIGIKTYYGLVEMLSQSEQDEPGGPDPIGDTRIHLKTSDIQDVESETMIELLDRSITQMVITRFITPDRNELILVTKNP